MFSSHTSRLYNQPITAHTMRDVILPFLKTHPDINELSFYKNNMDLECISLLANYLAKDTNIASLALCDNHINDTGAMLLMAMLSANKVIKKVNLSINDIGLPGAEALACAISNLTEFNISLNPIGDKGALALYAAKRFSSQLKEMILEDEYDYLTDENINTLIQQAINNFYQHRSFNSEFPYDSKEEMGLTFNSSLPIDAKIINNILIPYLNAHPEINALHFNEADLNEEMVKDLHTLVQSCQTLKSIKIVEFNPLGYKAILALKQAARNNFTSILLPLHYRDINHEDDLIKRNKSTNPNTLDFRCSGDRNKHHWNGYMGISSQDIINTIIPHLKSHPNITRLIFHRNRHITDGIIALAQASTNINALSITHCLIQPAGVQALAKNGNFIQLDLSGDNVTDDDLVMIVEQNPKLKILAVRSGTYKKRNYAKAVKAIAGLATLLCLKPSLLIISSSEKPESDETSLAVIICLGKLDAMLIIPILDFLVFFICTWLIDFELISHCLISHIELTIPSIFIEFKSINVFLR